MNAAQQSRAILVEAGASLRIILEQALEEQRYADVAEVASLADGVARLLGSSNASNHTQARSVQRSGSSQNIPVQDSTFNQKPNRRKSAREYPKFRRDGNRLIKIGWSKKNQSTYEHRAPKEAVVAFIQRLSALTTNGNVFVVEELMPVLDPSTGAEVPEYQAYLTLAWLRHEGIVEKKGRDGYVVPVGALQGEVIPRLWTDLQEK